MMNREHPQRPLRQPFSADASAVRAPNEYGGALDAQRESIDVMAKSIDLASVKRVIDHLQAQYDAAGVVNERLCQLDRAIYIVKAQLSELQDRLAVAENDNRAFDTRIDAILARRQEILHELAALANDGTPEAVVVRNELNDEHDFRTINQERMVRSEQIHFTREAARLGIDADSLQAQIRGRAEQLRQLEVGKRAWEEEMQSVTRDLGGFALSAANLVSRDMTLPSLPYIPVIAPLALDDAAYRNARIEASKPPIRSIDEYMLPHNGTEAHHPDGSLDPQGLSGTGPSIAVPFEYHAPPEPEPTPSVLDLLRTGISDIHRPSLPRKLRKVEKNKN
jgi:hypothetical protein